MRRRRSHIYRFRSGRIRCSVKAPSLQAALQAFSEKLKRGELDPLDLFIVAQVKGDGDSYVFLTPTFLVRHCGFSREEVALFTAWKWREIEEDIGYEDCLRALDGWLGDEGPLLWWLGRG
ncbi:MAG: hypothetical protein QXH67_00030 [Candidatus Bathyarchaeia archaeon]